jgi:hypothetical protein
MGPAAWAAVGRAILAGLARGLFGSRSGLPAILAKQVHHAIVTHDLELAAALLRDMAYRHKREFEDFMSRHRNDLPQEILDEVGWTRKSSR